MKLEERNNNMLRVVLDTNVIVSMLIGKSGTLNKIYQALEKGIFDIVISDEILEEYRQVLSRDVIRRYTKLSLDEINAFLSDLYKESIKIPQPNTMKVVKKDKSDDKFVSCALEGKAHFLVTGNVKHFQELYGNYEGCKICTPSEFWQDIEF